MIESLENSRKQTKILESDCQVSKDSCKKNMALKGWNTCRSRRALHVANHEGTCVFLTCSQGTLRPDHGFASTITKKILRTGNRLPVVELTTGMDGT